jgi:hypothetical protein
VNIGKIRNNSQTKQHVLWGTWAQSESINNDGAAEVCGQVFYLNQFFSVLSIIYSVLWVCYGNIPVRADLERELGRLFYCCGGKAFSQRATAFRNRNHLFPFQFPRVHSIFSLTLRDVTTLWHSDMAAEVQDP